MESKNPCPCGSGKTFGDCCEPLHKKERKAETAEQLMRSRYSAFATANVDYIMDTHDPETVDDVDRAGAEVWSKQSEWLGLEILRSEAGGKDDDTGVVDFVARYKAGGSDRVHKERASFRRIDGVWFFVNGEHHQEKKKLFKGFVASGKKKKKKK